jgi:hypothetical protein
MPLQNEAWAKVEHMRILVCHTCKKIEELPDFMGHPDDDVFLNYVVQDHPDHKGQLFRLPIPLWLIPEAQKTLVEQITAGTTSGLDLGLKGYYDTHNTFKEDALVCYKAHNSPKGGCPDFNSKKKELKPPTQVERKEAGVSTRDLPVIHLCSFCPVRTFMERKSRGD